MLRRLKNLWNLSSIAMNEKQNKDMLKKVREAMGVSTATIVELDEPAKQFDEHDDTL